VVSGAVTDVERIAHTLAGASMASRHARVTPPLRKLEHNARAESTRRRAALVEESPRNWIAPATSSRPPS